MRSSESRDSECLSLGLTRTMLSLSMPKPDSTDGLGDGGVIQMLLG
jgi:hypothetical protein